jgi:beta-N-acetylhexosaminidase
LADAIHLNKSECFIVDLFTDLLNIHKNFFYGAYVNKSILTLFLMIILSPFLVSQEKQEHSLTIEQKVGQLMMVGVPGKQINSTMKTLIDNYSPGGFIFFGYNLGSAAEIKELTANLQRYSVQSGSLPLFISIDQEGGRVVRITDGVTQFPGNMAFGSADDEKLVENAARVTGIQLRLLGVNMNLAPDIDVNNNPDNPVINTRAFGSRPEHVARLGRAYITGLQSVKCMAVAKHFPGHGDTKTDSHKALPLINYTIERLKQVELVPFEAAVKENSSAIMSAHIRYPKVEPLPYPATLSHRFLTEMLREDMGYDGLIMTDDLEMGAIAGKLKLGEASVRAIDAGADVILVTTHKNTGVIFSALVNAVKSGKISEERLNQSVNRILRAKTAYKIYNPENPTDLIPYNVSEEHQRYLKYASLINSIVSQKALYFFNGSEGKQVKLRDEDSLSVIIPYSSTFKSVLGRKSVPFTTRSSFLKSIKNDNTLRYVYYEVRDKNVSDITSLASRLPTNYILILISTDNPFVVTKQSGTLPVLFTFSNTQASYNAVVDAIQGNFEVKTDINIDLGFGRE